jgi:hypothetical protein
VFDFASLWVPRRSPAHAANQLHQGPDPRRSMLFACCGVAFAVLFGLTISTVAGALALGFTLIGCGIWRARAPIATRAAGIAVRSRGLDVFFYLAMGLAIAALTLIIPT